MNEVSSRGLASRTGTLPISRRRTKVVLAAAAFVLAPLLLWPVRYGRGEQPDLGTRAASQAPARAPATRGPDARSFVTATIPGKRITTRRTLDLEIDELGLVTHAGRDGDAELSISTAVLPVSLTSLHSCGRLLRKARSALLASRRARQESWGSCDVPGTTCGALTYRLDDGRQGLARVMRRGDTLVIVDAVYSSSESEATAFITSIRSSEASP